MKKKNKNDENALIKNCIFTALILLMKEKDYHNITITDITKKAGVSRMTYYRTYTSKEDILVQHFDQIARNLTEEIRQYPDVTPDKLICRFFAFFQEKSELILCLQKSNLLGLMMNSFVAQLKCLYDNIFMSHISNISLDYQLHYHTGGLFYALIYWIEHGQKESPEEMAKLVTAFIEHQNV